MMLLDRRLLFVSGKGGVGKSTVSVNLALGLANKGYQVGLMDVDLHGPSIAGMVGIKGLLDVTQDQQVIPKTVGDHLKVVSMQSLMQDADQAVIWRGPAKTGMIRQFIADVHWEDLDFLIVDSPPACPARELCVIRGLEQFMRFAVELAQ